MREACIVTLLRPVSLLTYFALLRLDALEKACEVWEGYNNNA